MKVIITESQLKKVIEQSVAGAANYGMITRNTNTFVSKDKQLPFTPENLSSEIRKLGIKHPDVVLAQAKWESGHFKSKVFQENNNLFGMKLARQRDTTAIGENRGHAKYKNWQDSVKDYKLWQDSNGMSVLPKEQYINKLSNIYCPPPDCEKGMYSMNIKKMLK